MTHDRLGLGVRGEDAAVAFLKKNRYRILERNFNTPLGEIDIIARKGKVLVFIEVKTRSSTSFGTPAEAVGVRKQRQIIKTAKWYLAEGHGAGLQPRFDVIGVLMQGARADIEHVVAAFSL